MERERERERDKGGERGRRWDRENRGRIFYRSPRGIIPRFQQPPPRAVFPRNYHGTQGRDLPGGYNKHPIQSNAGHHGALGYGEVSNRHRQPAIKKTFRELFSEKDLAEGGKWVEVRRRKELPRPRDRSPIIKNPCFRCGLGGHFRRNCPRRANMKCYGCNSQYHLLRDCTVIHRPAELKVELSNVYDIEEKVESLSKFAIFRSKDLVNINALRQAMIKEFWEFGWEGKIFPIDKQSFLVGFVSELRRDLAVLAGKKQYEGFSGTLYAWNEDRGASKVMRPVIVWITLEDLPLHFWGKEEISSLISPFGKIHKLGENFFKKKRADVVKVMVEVDDLTVIPKKIECSYKGARDNKLRFYSVNVVPAPSCLPVSQWTEDRYNLYVDEGGSRDELEEAWSEDWSRRGEAARRRATEAGVQEDDDGAVNKPGFAGQTQGVHVPVNTPMNKPDYEGLVLGVHAPSTRDESGARSQERSKDHPVEEHGGDQGNEGRALAKEEEDRRRKGKGILIGASPGATRVCNEPAPIPSGSGSCDPQVEGGDQEQEPLSSQDADSKAESVEARGLDKEKPIVISEGSSDDMDLGGEAAAVRAMEMAGGKVKVEEPALIKPPTQKSGGGEARKGTGGASRGSSISVPPGYVRKPKSTAGEASPFGKLHRGGFKFLKRPATSVSSGARHISPAPTKKNKPLSSMPDEEMKEVAASVGVAKELGADQLKRIRSLEEERASS